MSPWRKKPVSLIIADAGPLISLACADLLELLGAFGRPVLVADVVREECLRTLNAAGEERLIQWFEAAGDDRFRIVDTPFLNTFRDALRREANGEDLDATRGFGDATMSWLLRNLDRVGGRDDVPLVLTQDGAFGEAELFSRREAHVLSTRQWLEVLERLGVIASARQAVLQMEAGGRQAANQVAGDLAARPDGTGQPAPGEAADRQSAERSFRLVVATASAALSDIPADVLHQAEAFASTLPAQSDERRAVLWMIGEFRREWSEELAP